MNSLISYRTLDVEETNSLVLELIQKSKTGPSKHLYTPIQETEAKLSESELGILLKNKSFSKVFCLSILQNYLLNFGNYRPVSVSGSRHCFVCGEGDPSWKFVKFKSELYTHQDCHKTLIEIAERLIAQNSEFVVASRI